MLLVVPIHTSFILTCLSLHSSPPPPKRLNHALPSTRCFWLGSSRWAIVRATCPKKTCVYWKTPCPVAPTATTQSSGCAASFIVSSSVSCTNSTTMHRTPNRFNDGHNCSIVSRRTFPRPMCGSSSGRKLTRSIGNCRPNWKPLCGVISSVIVQC